MPGQEAGRVAAAVRPGREVFAGPVQREQLIDEGRADAEGVGDLADGAVAAQDRGSDLLPQVQGVGFHGRRLLRAFARTQAQDAINHRLGIYGMKAA